MDNNFDVVKYINKHTGDDGKCRLGYNEDFFNYLDNVDPESITDREKKALEKVVELNWIYKRIDRLPENMRVLTSLTELDLSDNQITDISPLSELTSLTELYLFDNQINDISTLSELKSLITLNLNSNQITDISPLSELKSLITLNLNSNQITDISPLSELTSLTILDLNSNQIEEIEEGTFSGLTSLSKLDLSGNQINDISPLSELTSLTGLYLSNQKLKYIPKPIVYIAFNNELNFTDVIKRRFIISGEFNEAYDNEIALGNTTIAQQPKSLFLMNNQELLESYYEAEKIQVKEAKVMFLGEGGAGKSYTVKRIKNRGNIYKNSRTREYYETEETDTIEITEIPPEKNTTPNADITLKLWDFGGQEYMHSMHRCFLTENALYVVVLCGRTGNLTKQAIYWLENINSYAPNSPVILAVNCWNNDANPGVDLETLKKRYPNKIRDVVYSSKSSEKDTFNKLTEAITEEAIELDGYNMELPTEWASVIDEINKCFKNKNEITKQEYKQICRDANKSGMLTDDITVWLLDWLNVLGVCFSDHWLKDKDGKKTEEKTDYKIFKPSWLFRGIYSIIKTNDDLREKLNKLKVDTGKDGVFPIEYIENAISESTKEEYKAYDGKVKDLLAIMENFMLAYRVTDDFEFIPALCPVDAPKSFISGDEKYKQKMHVEFRYRYLPDSVLQRLMVKAKAASTDNPTRHQMHNPWKCGMEFSSHGAVALIRKDEVKPVLSVKIFADDTVTHNAVHELFTWIREAIEGNKAEEQDKRTEGINTSMNLTSECYIVVESRAVRPDMSYTVQPNFNIKGLRDAQKNGIREVTFLDNGVCERFNVADLLNIMGSEGNDPTENGEEHEYHTSNVAENEVKETMDSMRNGQTIINAQEVYFGDNNQKSQHGTGNTIAGGDVIQHSYNRTTVSEDVSYISEIIKMLSMYHNQIEEKTLDNMLQIVQSNNELVSEIIGEQNTKVDGKESKFTMIMDILINIAKILGNPLSPVNLLTSGKNIVNGLKNLFPEKSK